MRQAEILQPFVISMTIEPRAGMGGRLVATPKKPRARRGQVCLVRGSSPNETR